MLEGVSTHLGSSILYLCFNEQMNKIELTEINKKILEKSFSILDDNFLRD